mgnify:CR=1 FL=1
MRFIIISVPPEPLYGELRSLQAFFSAESGAREALRYPPHITLRTGLLCPDEAAEKAAHAFLEHAGRVGSAEVRSKGPVASGYRDSGGVERGFLGYPVEPTEHLMKLHQGLLAFEPWRKGPQGSFEPHISLCYQDISAAAAKDLLTAHHARVESLRPVWEIRSVELWIPVGAVWSFHSKANLEKQRLFQN